MKIRFLLPLLCAYATACTCGSELTPTPIAPLEFVTTVDFGAAWLGQEVTRTLNVRNPSRAAQEFPWLPPDAPFSAGEAPARVGGGDTVELTLRFSPTAGGLHEGSARIGARLIHLLGEGLPECHAADCMKAHFDLEAGECVTAPLPDETPCALTCADVARCFAGACLAVATTTCDDGDLCTLDACGADGCFHTPVTCEVTDPCRVPRCEPGAGCVSDLVEDGVICGEETCLEADICLNGSCVRRPRGNADDCRYDTVAATTSHACAFTRSGKLRCWGDSVWSSLQASVPSGLGLPYAFVGHPPRDVATPPANGALAVVAGTTFVGLAAGGLHSVGSRPVPDAGEVFATLACTQFSCSGQLADDGAFGWRLNMPTTWWSPGPVLGVTGAFGLLETDGGYTTPIFGAHELPAPAVAAVDSDNQHFVLLADDSVHRTASFTGANVTHFADAGGSALSYFVFYGEPGHLCLAQAGGLIQCLHNGTGEPLLSGQVPEDIAALSGPCARTTGGRVFCFQRPSTHLRPMPVEDGGRLLPGNMLAWVTADGELRLVAANASQLTSYATPPCIESPASSFERWCVRTMGTAPDAAGIITRPSASPNANGLLLLANGELRSWPLLGLMASDVSQIGYVSLQVDGGLVGDFPGVRAVQTSANALLLDDGGVYDPIRRVTLPFGPVQTLGDARCAVLTNGQVRCWDRVADGGYTVTSPSGLRLFPREVTGTAAAGCAVTSANGVQCWGQNSYGQLGRTGPASEHAVDIAIGEPVRHVRHGQDGTVCLETVSNQIQCWGRDAWSPPETTLVEIVR